MNNKSMIINQFHPSDELLIEYTAGSLSASLSVCVSVHLEYCDTCRQQRDRLDCLAGMMFENLSVPQAGSMPPAEEQDGHVLDNIFDRIDAQSQTRAGQAKVDMALAAAASQPVLKGVAVDTLPSTVNKLLAYDPDQLNWRSHGRNVASARLSQYEGIKTSLIRIKKGAKIPEHSHTGTEYTVVLQGSFSDADGLYRQGDFIARDASHQHAPVATADADCLCLIAMDAPLKFTNPLMELYNKVMPL